MADYQTICKELVAYGAGLEFKPEIIALNKIDAADPQIVTGLSKELTILTGTQPLAISAVTGQGVDVLLARLLEVVDEARAAERELAGAAGDGGWRP